MQPRKSKNGRGPTRSAYEHALDLLDFQARSETELRRVLLRKGEDPADVDAAIERLRSVGVLDDATYSRQVTRSKALGAGHSRRRIAQELAKRGVSRTVAGKAIEEVFEEERVDEAATLDQVARKKLRTLAKLDAATQKRRLYAFLARRGYDSDDVSKTVRRLLGGNAEEA